MNADQLDRLHEGGLRVLAETGVVFRDDETLAVFGRHGFRVEGQRVFFSPGQVEAALAAAPRSFRLEARNAERDLEFGAGRPVMSNVAGAAFLMDDGRPRAATMADQETSVRLCHMAANIDLIGHTLSPPDVSDPGRYEQTLYNHFTLSDKQFEHPISDVRHLRAGLDMTEIVFGAGWHRRPRMFAVINPMSPLVYDVHTCVTALELAGRDQPLCVTPCAMAGTTGPATLAGLLVQQHAETLAGIVLIQLVSPGCPSMYGGFSTVTSMRTGEPLFGPPEYWTLMAATVELAHHVGLAVRAGCGGTDAHALDLQAGMETALGLASVLERGVDYVLQAAGCLSSISAVSFAKLIVDDTLIGELRRRPAELAFDDDDLALDVIAAVGPGGDFLGQRHTRAHARDFEGGPLFNRKNHDAWAEDGGRRVDEVAAAAVARLLDAYEEPAIDGVVRRQLRAYCGL